MGGISSSVGLISGIDTRSLINQLIQIESRPKQLVQQRILQLQQRQAAYLSINSSLLALRGAAGSFNTDRIFDSNTATSSNQSVLTGTATTNAAVGSYSFIVNRLVTTQQVLSRGFSDRNVTGLGASEFSFEFGGGGVTSETTLGELNGGQGVQRGKIQITDRSGASAEVDLSTAVTVNDVLDRINSAGGYLRSLTDKARAGKFSTWPMIMALLRERLDAAKPGKGAVEETSPLESASQPKYQPSESLLKSLKNNPRF